MAMCAETMAKWTDAMAKWAEEVPKWAEKVARLVEPMARWLEAMDTIRKRETGVATSVKQGRQYRRVQKKIVFLN